MHLASSSWMRRANASKIRHQFGNPTYIKFTRSRRLLQGGEDPQGVRHATSRHTWYRVRTATSVRDGKPTLDSHSGLCDVLVNTCFFGDVCSSAATRSKVPNFKSQARQAFVSSFATLPQMLSCASFHLSHHDQPPNRDQNISGTHINGRVATAGARDLDRSGIQIFGPEVSTS
jgi:hypothetical protein